MKDFFNKISSNELYQRLFKNPWSYLAGAVFLAFLNTLTLAFTGSGWGVTGAFSNWLVWILRPLGVDFSSWSQLNTEAAIKLLDAGFFKDALSIRNLGIVFGALLAVLLASQFKIKKIKSWKQVFAAILGGILMGYGARLAAGCNIGALFTATASMSLSGWVFAGALFIGGFIGSKLLTKYFM